MAAISIQIDDDVQSRFDEFCTSIGLSVSGAFNLFAKTVVREQKFPFDITDTPNAQLLKAFKEAEAISRNPSSKGYTDIDQMITDILNVSDSEPEYQV